MLEGLKNKLMIFIILFGTYNIVSPIFVETFYDPNNYVLLVVSLIAFAILLISKKKLTISFWGVMLIAAFSFLFLVEEGGFSLVYYTKWVIFVISLLFYLVVLTSAGTVAEGNYKLLYWSVLLQLVLFAVEAFDKTSYITTRGGTYLLLCFDNKNATAMHLLTLACILILYAERVGEKRGRLHKIVPLLAFALCVFFIVLTGSRSSLVGIIFIALFAVVPKLKRHFSRPLLLFFVLLPFLFAAVYVALYLAGYGDLQLFGRPLFNGRQDLWVRVFEGDALGWIFGMHADFARPDGVPFQLHNGIVDLIASYGLIVTALFLFMIYKLLSSLLKTKNDTNLMVVVCLCALIIQSIGEAALFNGTRVIYICMILSFVERNPLYDAKRVASATAENGI